MTLTQNEFKGGQRVRVHGGWGGHKGVVIGPWAPNRVKVKFDGDLHTETPLTCDVELLSENKNK